MKIFHGGALNFINIDNNLFFFLFTGRENLMNLNLENLGKKKINILRNLSKFTERFLLDTLIS